MLIRRIIVVTRLPIVLMVAVLVTASSPKASHAQAAPPEEPRHGLGLSSEAVHKIYGAAILTTSATLLAEESGAFTLEEVRFALPGLTMAAGGLLMIDPLLHGRAAPSNYRQETRQHLLLGGAMLVAGSVDFAAEAAWLDHWSWGLVLPAGLLAASGSFFFHAQHGDPAQHELMTTQHRLLGATLAVAAVTKALAAVPSETDDEPRWPGMQSAWMIAAGLAGIQLLLYSEGDVATTSDHAKHGVSVGFTGRGLSIAGSF
jgi:hypothetical protein